MNLKPVQSKSPKKFAIPQNHALLPNRTYGKIHPLNESLFFSYLKSYPQASTDIHFSLPSALTEQNTLIALSNTTIILLSHTHSLMINTLKSQRSVIKKYFPRKNTTKIILNSWKSPYLIIDICTLFFELADDSNDLSICIESSDADRGTHLFERFLSNQNSLLVSQPEFHEISSNSNDLLSSDYIVDPRESQKTIKLDRDLYKVTEYNESLEYSQSLSRIDVINSQYAMLTSSIIDKFPKISVASLSISEGSQQNAYEIFKQSCSEFSDLGDANYYIIDKSFNENQKRDSPLEGTTHAMTLNESEPYKNPIETRSECCECSRCEIF